IGILLLLFMLGLEYTEQELKENLRTGWPAGFVDLMLNFTPGFLTGILLGWQPLPAVLLGGVTYISSSGIVAKILADLKWTNNPEIPSVISVLVFEDLVMAIYLPLVSVLLAGGSLKTVAIAEFFAVATVVVIFVVALRYGQQISTFFGHESDEIILLTVFGAVLLVGGLAQRFQVSAVIGAFLVGIALSGPIAEKSRQLLAPLRDLFAAIFFFFFGLETDPRSLPNVALVAVGLGLISTITKLITGYWAAGRRV